MLALLIVLLLSSHVLPLVQSLTCDESTQYFENNKCCKKCEPGQHMEKRCGRGSPDTQCATCQTGYYLDVYNDILDCHQCTMCTKENMKYEKNCTPKRDAVCTCDEGYECSPNSHKCEMCVEVQTYTTSPSSTFTRTAPHTQDNVWISVSLCFACVCVCVLFTCFLLISRHARPCGWIMSASIGLWRSKKSSEFSQCTKEDEVPMPVQEVCGKTEKLEDV
ncbi:unnamed protein product [Leuciscus chuanchicus]